MDSATSVERPESMSCASSGATTTASTTPRRGERPCPLPVRGDPSRRESPMESRQREEIRSENYTQPGQNGVLAIDGPILAHSLYNSCEQSYRGKAECLMYTLRALTGQSRDNSWPPVEGGKRGKGYDLGSGWSGEHLRYITQPWIQDDLGVVRPEFQASSVDERACKSPTRLTDASANSRSVLTC